MVGLPDGVLGLTGDELTYSDAEKVQNALYHGYKIEVRDKSIYQVLHACSESV